MFEKISKRLTPKGWPAEVEIRELVADDVLPMFMNGPVDSLTLQRHVTHLATYTADGERVFESAEAVGQVPARMFPGLMQIVAEVMRLNMPAVSVEGGDETGPI